MCRMRSIRETAEYFREMDPETQITEKCLRNMIANGEIPIVKRGSKYLINIDLLLDIFGGSLNGKMKLSGSPDFVVNK